MSFWNKRTPCWQIISCPPENRAQCGAYLAQHYPCWDLPLEQRCPIVEKVESCSHCPVHIEHIGSYEYEKRNVSGQKSVLLADDELLIRWSVYQTLRKAGYLVELAKDGDEALDMIIEHDYDFYMLDLRMPGQDVFSICEKIFDRTANSHVILMTAYGSEAVQKRAFDMGITYIQKPLDMNKIAEILD